MTKAQLSQKKGDFHILISRSHTMEIEEARIEVDKIAMELSEDLGITCQWENNRLIFKRLGINGYIEIKNSEIRIHVEKSFFVPVSDEWIRKHIETRLDQHIR